MLRLGLVALVVLGCAAGGKQQVRGTKVTPVLKMEFTDHVYYHNVGLTWDGDYYYTVNGGNTDYSNLNKYDASGSLDESYDVGADGTWYGYQLKGLE